MKRMSLLLMLMKKNAMHVVDASCNIDLSFDMDLSKLLHGYVKVVPWIC